MASKGEKTEQPTEKRKKDARKKGTTSKSQDLAPWLSLLAGTYVLPMTIGGLARAMQTAFADTRTIAADPDPSIGMHLLGATLLSGFIAIAPLLLVCMLVGVIGTLGQTGLMMSLHPLKPDFKRLNPIAGVKRLLSVRSLWETLKQIAKAAVIGVVAWPRIQSLSERLTEHGRVPLMEGLGSVAAGMLGLLRTVCWTVVLIALFDFAFQKRQGRRDMRMTKQEVRDEYRSSEGDPQIKQRIRAMQTAMARRRMMGDVAGASVIITNPTHYAVAIRYDVTGGGGAPKVVASGVDGVALKIRERAVDAGVPVVEAPPLARAVYRSCAVGDEIPAALFEAVAKVLVFVRRLKGGISRASSLPLPRTYQVDADALAEVPAKGRRRFAPAA